MKAHLICLSLIVGLYFAGSYFGGRQESAPEKSGEEVAAVETARLDTTPQVGPSEIPGFVPPKDPRWNRLRSLMPKDKYAAALFASLQKEKDKNRTNELMIELQSNPEEAFATLDKSIDALPEEYEKERNRFLQIAMEMDVSKEQKKEMLEKYMLDGRDANGKLLQVTSKITAFDLILEQEDLDFAREMLEKGQFKGDLARVLKTKLETRKPAQE